MIRQIILLILGLVLSLNCHAQIMTIINSTWTPTPNAITEAGNNYTSSTITNASYITYIYITMPGIYSGSDATANHYTVQIKRTDSGLNWDTVGLTISATRTGNGTGGGSSILGTSMITGGTSPLPITISNQYFFDGNNYGTTPRINIPIQYEIGGISVLLPVNIYSTTITYTLIDN
ncbi:hypothetical protein [Emticicia sp. SJ17W-69]|uniref:hypothetical protein n=1 Tax=Emticicia sp. SJ17W-69 TaxID=3421657 RepID=UPI003EB84753